ncbi:MAG TPA: Sel1-like repeat-containing protein kinase family protein [Prevotella sp.]|jgi:TPR repeat protein|nr:Sel1-like repeat-containing protein kinase family protein [Prevotella sp.]
MQYPLISEYVRAIQDASNNLDELAHLVPVQDDHGEPYRSSGAFAVVFKMKDEQTEKCYALKCFTEEQEGRAEAYRQIADELEFVDSSYITSVKYLDKEIFVDSSCEEDEFPVLLMDWIDGETMENYIAENYQDNYIMAMLCYRFCKMAAWLRSQPFAHGDIKPDNIMVRPDGNLTLVDYDGMFVPAMKGQKSPTIGTKDFSHPLRTVDDFDETIDDFALASIALSLKAIALKPSLLDEYGAADRLLFSAEDYRDLSKSKVLAALQELMNDEEVNTLLSMFLLVCAKKNLGMCSFRLFYLCRSNNDLEEIVKLADAYYEGKEKDYNKAFSLYSDAASKGSLYALACLGFCYCEGKGCMQDFTRGLILIRESASQNNPKGQNVMGICYSKGYGVPKDDTEAVEWYRRAAEQGYARAQSNLGVCYAKGYGVVQCYEEAVGWIRKSANQGYAKAQGLLGVCYQKGKGVDPDDVEAVEWYRKSARQGNSTSQWLLGLCYEQGKGVIQNYKEAVECYRKSAEQDNASAQYHLGLCYEKGYGVVQDYGQAIFWYQKSANQGYSKAEHRLEICYRGQDIDAGCYVSYLDDSGLEGYDFSRLRLKRDL